MDYVKRRLALYGKTDFSFDFWWVQRDKILADPKLERGDFILKQFELFEIQLRLNGFFLLLISEGSDQYYPFIVDADEYTAVIGLKVGDLIVEPLESL